MLLISSVHTDEAIDEESGEKRKPEVIKYFNHHKICVDVMDKMPGTYNVQRGTISWPMIEFYKFQILQFQKWLVSTAKSSVWGTDKMCEFADFSLVNWGMISLEIS